MPEIRPKLINHPARDKGGDQRTILLGGRDWALADLATAFQAGLLPPPHAQRFMDHLWAIGFKTMKTYMRTKMMKTHCIAKGRPVTWFGDDETALSNREDLRDEVAAEVLILAIESFGRRGKSEWSREKGASIETWFIGACILNFGQGYLTWAKNSGRNRPGEWDLSAEDTIASPHIPYALIEAKETVQQIYALAPPRDHPLLDLLWEGHSASSAAFTLGLSPKTVEGRMRQIRKRARQAVRVGQITPPFGILSAVNTPSRKLGSVVS